MGYEEKMLERDKRRRGLTEAGVSYTDSRTEGGWYLIAFSYQVQVFYTQDLNRIERRNLKEMREETKEDRRRTRKWLEKFIEYIDERNSLFLELRLAKSNW